MSSVLMDASREKKQLIAELDGAGASGPAPDSIRRYLKLVNDFSTTDALGMREYSVGP